MERDQQVAGELLLQLKAALMWLENIESAAHEAKQVEKEAGIMGDGGVMEDEIIDGQPLGFGLQTFRDAIGRAENRGANPEEKDLPKE